MAILEITSDEAFHEAVKQHKAVLIDFFAVWCGPCKVIAPFIEKHSEEARFEHVHFAKVDVDKLSKLSDDLDIQAMPTLLLYKDGERTDTLVDPKPQNLLELLEKTL